MSVGTGELRERIAAFVRDEVIPREDEAAAGEHGPEPELRRELQAAARSAGIYGPTIATELGGLGLDHAGQAVALEAAGYSLLGPQALNCAAPDEGNMALLTKIATPAQRERFLVPLAAGEIRSGFAMTEPAPGAGSDPAALRTTARRIDGGYAIDGEKWFITGALGASFFICMARTSERIDHDQGATMFLVEASNPGVEVVRAIATPDRAAPGGHCVVRFSDCRVGDEDVLGEVGLGYRYAQVRLAPARLTHCMRFTGLAQRAQDIAIDVCTTRELFGSRLPDLGLAQALLADATIDLEACRALISSAARVLDDGGSGRHETSVAKVFVAEAVNRVCDRAIQLCGARGVSHELPLVTFQTEMRAFRIYDGPSEAHRMAIARRAVRRRAR